MNEGDRAHEIEELERAQALQRARQVPTEPPATGRCFNCRGPVGPGIRFCQDVEGACEEDYRKRLNRLRPRH